MEKPRFISDIQIGIGDMCKATGVTGRQLRYWGERGYITTIAAGKGSLTRKYNLETLYQVRAIKHFIDEGYTLSKAVEKSRRREKEMGLVHHFFVDGIQKVVLTDEEKNYGKLLLGVCDDKQIIAVIDQNGVHLESKAIEE